MILLNALSTLNKPSDQPALIGGERSLTFFELHQAILKESQSLQQQGLCSDDVVLLPMGMQITDLIRLLAILNLGAPVLLCNPKAGEHALQQLQARCSVLLPLTPGSKLQRLNAAVPFSAGQLKPALGILSSGSTGAPKQIWHSLAGLLASAAACNQLLPLQFSDRSLVSLPLFHVGGLALVLRALQSGSALLFNAPADNISTYGQWQVSRASLVPTQLQRLLQQTDTAPDCQFLLGGAPIANELLQQARAAGWKLHQSYGLSEMGSQVMTETRPNHWQCLPHAQLHIVNGEIRVKGQSLFLGYGEPHQLQQTLTDDGFFATGDLAQIESDCFSFLGRTDNMFISGGENILPESLEQRLMTSGMLNRVVIVPKAHPEWGAACTAVIDPKPSFNIEDFKHFMQEQLAKFEQPKELFRWREGHTLKIQRQQFINWIANNDLEKIS